MAKNIEEIKAALAACGITGAKEVYYTIRVRKFQQQINFNVSL